MTTHLYGIKNCDTMKKARAWLDAAGVAYTFHDYKKEGVDADVITQALAAHGWDVVINRRGTTWRKLPLDVQERAAESALALACEQPSLIKRPLLLHAGKTYIGFKPDDYAAIFSS